MLEKLITINKSGIPCAPSLKQIQDKDILELYKRDKSEDKSNYIKEAGVIFYIADIDSEPNQAGLTEAECLQAAIENYGLPKDYKPDNLVLTIIDKYKTRTRGTAGATIEALLKSLALSSKIVSKIIDTLNVKLNENITMEEVGDITSAIKSLRAEAIQLPHLTASLKEAHENLNIEKQEAEYARGNTKISSSMRKDL